MVNSWSISNGVDLYSFVLKAKVSLTKKHSPIYQKIDLTISRLRVSYAYIITQLLPLPCLTFQQDVISKD